MNGFAERLRAKRIERGLSQEDVANVLHMTRNGYCQIENGVNGKKMQYLPQIAKLFGCRIDDLFPEMDDVLPGMSAKQQQESAPDPMPETMQEEVDEWAGMDLT